MKTWSMFLVALGCFLIVLSPTMEVQTPLIISGLIVSLTGAVLFWKGNKKK